MTYFGILAKFVFPPLLALAVIVPIEVWAWLAGKREKPELRPYWGMLLLAAIALVYTTPWDNYLVATDVWWYDPAFVSGMRIGWVPVEEYTFFVLQTLLTGLLTVWLGRVFPERRTGDLNRIEVRRIGMLAIGALWLISMVLLLSRWRQDVYLALILSWALVPLLLQAAFGLDILMENWRPLALGVGLASIYLWFVDAIALRAGTWTINPGQTLGVALGPIPVEEMVFFLMTNLIIAFGVTLISTQAGWQRAEGLLEKWKVFRSNTADRKTPST